MVSFGTVNDACIRQCILNSTTALVCLVWQYRLKGRKGGRSSIMVCNCYQLVGYNDGEEAWFYFYS